MAQVIVAQYEALGGIDKDNFIAADGQPAGRTQEGRFVLEKCAQHQSPFRYRKFSSIPWGTPMKEENGTVKVFMGRQWRPLREFTPVKKEELIKYSRDWFGKFRLPDKWIFNDFGHITCYYFKDINNNRKLDKGIESRHGEFIHPTPVNEAESALGGNEAVKLYYSHGCIHVKPKDIDEMIAKGYLKKGNTVVIHSYNHRLFDMRSGQGRPPFEFHFFPLEKRIVIYGEGH